MHQGHKLSGSRMTSKNDKSGGRERRIAQLQAQLVQAENFRLQGKLDQSEVICRKLLEVSPTYVGVLQTLGLVSLEKQNYRQAMNCFLTATATAPDDATNLTNLAASWLGLECPQMAAIMLREAERLDAENAAVSHMWGEVHLADANYAAAIAAYRRALELDPGNEQSLFKLAECLAETGCQEEAGLPVKQLMKQGSTSVFLPATIARLPDGTLGQDVNLRQLLAKAEKTPRETEEGFELVKAFVLAEILHREGKYEGAWNAAKRGNQMLAARDAAAWQTEAAFRAAVTSAAKAQRKRSTARPAPRSGESDRFPLFILGPSRSGKSSLERLVSTHEDIVAGHECRLAHLAALKASQKAGLDNIDDPANLPSALQMSFAEQFRQLMADRLAGARAVTITHPGLIAGAGFIAEALPEARFIFVRRDQQDVAARIFMRRYRSGNHFASSLATIREFLDWYDELMMVYERALKDRVLCVGYKDLVENPPQVRDRVIAHCGLAAMEGDAAAVANDAGYGKLYASFMQ